MKYTTLTIAHLTDDLCSAVDAARAKAAGNARWLNAIDTAWGWLLQQETIRYAYAAHALQVPSATDASTVYEANGACQCKAFAESNACWHRAAARLVRRALETRNARMAAVVAEVNAAADALFGY